MLSAEELARILEAAPGPGIRYRAAFNVAYGGGLRASEVTQLKIGDIDSDRMLIRIDQGKGCKDRHVMRLCCTNLGLRALPPSPDGLILPVP
ncbi:tyrosine-type recombinase/integrase [Ruegeria jejuensis]|uniref:tyrosine-type recombinase/integrase n=1 Tax=Ruegeria jejuensis TaxID=3233338 RepID=UPI00355BCB46